MTFSLQDHRQPSMTLARDYVFGDCVELRFLLWNRNRGERRRANARRVFVQIVSNPEGIRVPRRGLVLRSSIKVEVKKKHICFGWNVSCFAAHVIERDLF